MEAYKQRRIRDGTRYNDLFPAANRETVTVLDHAEVSDTVAFLPKVVKETLYQTHRIAQELKGRTIYESCKNIWHFVYDHIAYAKDRDGYEQIRSPARTWYDRKKGVDCDCYSTFISSVLTNLGIRHLLRITKYNHDYFQHIYPVALTADGRQISIDCVTEQFDYEVPYSEKKDFIMELQYLNGIEGAYDGNHLEGTENLDYVRYHHDTDNAAADKSDLSGHEKFEDFLKHPDSIPDYGVRKKKGFKKVLNFINRLNPATLTLRNGVLASMKLNISQLGKKLRWTYLTPNQAKAHGMDMSRWEQLVRIRQKLDNIYYGAGGKPENLQKAILHGKGNKDKGVHGLGDFFESVNGVAELEGMDAQTPLRQLLGADLYQSEHEGMSAQKTFGDLGEPLTMTAVASASGVIAALVSMIRKVGDIFGGKSKHSSDFSENADNTDLTSGKNKQSDNAGDGSDGTDPSTGLSRSQGGASGNTGMQTARNSDSGDTFSADQNPSSGIKGFWAQHKKVLLPASAVAAGATALLVGIGMHRKSKKDNHPVSGIGSGIGTEKGTKKKSHGGRHKENHHRKKYKKLPHFIHKQTF